MFKNLRMNIDIAIFHLQYHILSISGNPNPNVKLVRLKFELQRGVVIQCWKIRAVHLQMQTAENYTN